MSAFLLSSLVVQSSREYGSVGPLFGRGSVSWSWELSILVSFLAATALRLLTQLRLEQRASGDPRDKLYVGGELSSNLMYASYLVVWVLALRTLLKVRAPTTASLTGMGVMFSGMVLRFLALPMISKEFASHIVVRRDQRLVTSGIYAVIRHPLQLGLLIEILGMCLLAGSGLAWAILPAIASVVVQKNRAEDRVLRQAIGHAAAQYQERVPGMNLPLGISRALARCLEGRSIVSDVH